MRIRAVWALLTVAAVLAGGPVLAHHSVPGTFDVNKTTMIKGTVSKVDWINPHIYIYVDVKEGSGALTTYKVETLPTNHMRRAGLTRADIVEGAKAGAVTIHMYPALKNAAAGFLLRITFAEGHFYHLFGEDSEIARASN
jgi:dihydroxyacetone kinase DhaKLM complex PTS-EIIA-like component DhaM